MLHFLIGIIDIGSTGTRLNIFGYSKDKDLVHYKKYEVYGGLHKMQLHEIESNLKVLVDQVPRVVHRIPMGFYATAGFRHPLNYRKLFYIKKFFKNFNIKEFGILSGKYEGYLGYQSLKYILNNPNFILIDMGGKSTQVVTKDYYKSYKIGFTNIEEVNRIRRIKPVKGDLPVYISSGFTRRKHVRLADIKNRHLKKFLNKLGIRKDLRGMKVNWALGMSLRFLNEEL